MADSLNTTVAPKAETDEKPIDVMGLALDKLNAILILLSNDYDGSAENGEFSSPTHTIYQSVAACSALVDEAQKALRRMFNKHEAPFRPLAVSAKATRSSTGEKGAGGDIEKVRRAWEVSIARLNLECTEAGDGDEVVAAACKRHDKRADDFFEQIMDLKATTEEDAYELVSLAMLLLKDEGSRERVSEILRKAWIDLGDRAAKRVRDARALAA